MVELRNRRTIEDIFQRVFCSILPKLPPERIRPAYQQDMVNGDYIVNEFGETEIKPFTPYDNYMYFTVIFDGENTQSFLNADGSTSIRRGVKVAVDFYGEESSQLAICLQSLVRAESFMYTLEAQGLYLQQVDENINQVWELVNEEWVERHNFSITFNECVEIANPKPNVIAKDYEVDIDIDMDVVVDVNVDTEAD